jgi:hypothetical protein
MQSKDPKLTFQRAWDSLRVSHPHLFDEDEAENEKEEPLKALRAELAKFAPLKVQADLGSEEYMEGFMRALLKS